MRMECECASVNVIKWDAIEELCPTEAADLFELEEKYEIDAWRAAYYFEEGEDPEVMLEFSLLDDDAKKLNEIDIKQAAAEVETAWKALQAAFAKATTVGGSHLTLRIGFHCTHPVHRLSHEDEQFLFFWVEGVHQLSPAGEKFKDLYEW